jgi:hypothetical protein
LKTQFSHNLFSSFFLWFEARLLSSQGQAYIGNQSNSFQYVDFKDIPSGSYGYQGRFRGLVADSSVSPPNSGVFINGSFVTGANTGIKIDYLNGRVIVPSASGTGLTITANNTIKEVNLYPYDDDEAQLVISSDFVDYNSQSSTFLSSLVNQLDQKTYLLPACFLRYVTTENENAGFGGEKDSKTRIRAVVIAKDNYIIDGVLSLFGDTKGFCVNIIPYENYPYGKYNTVKSFPYSYSSYISNYQTKSYIEDVTTSKLDYSIAMDKMERNILVGFIDFDLSTFRQPV